MNANEVKTIVERLCEKHDLKYSFEDDPDSGLFFAIKPENYEKDHLTDYKGLIIVDGAESVDWVVSIDGLYKKFEFVDSENVLEYLITSLIPDMHYPCAEKQLADKREQELQEGIKNGTIDPYA